MGWILKLAVFAFVVLAIVSWWRSLKIKKVEKGQSATLGKTVESPQKLVCCEHCGVLIPKDVATYGRLGAYCSKAHQFKDERK